MVWDEGVPRCSYSTLREHLGPLEAARFTVFDQTYIDGAIATLREHSRGSGSGGCSPKSCPSRWNRLLNSFRAGP